MDTEINQTNESHACVSDSDGLHGVAIPKEVEKETNLANNPEGVSGDTKNGYQPIVEVNTITKRAIDSEYFINYNQNVLKMDGAAIAQSAGESVEQNDDVPMPDPVSETIRDMQYSNSNNQNATSALEEEGPFCESVKEALIELEKDESNEQLATASNNSQSQDIVPNTNESNNTNACIICDALPPTADNPVVEITPTSVGNVKGKARDRSRSGQRSLRNIPRKNYAAPSRRTAKNSSSRRRPASQLRVKSLSNKRQRRKN